jgi:ubiquinone/menaquinone biosynthesis C-methylase UbiE
LDAVLELGGAVLERGGRMFDVGCGGGWLLAELSERGVDAERLHGVDLIESRVDAARRRVPGADIRFGDATALPFDDGNFDLVTMLTALSSMPRDSVGPALREARRVLAPGGLVLIYEPRIGNPFNSATVRISAGELDAVLGPSLTSRRLTGLPLLTRRLGRMAPRLYPLLARGAPTHRLTAHEPGRVPRPRG